MVPAAKALSVLSQSGSTVRNGPICDIHGSRATDRSQSEGPFEAGSGGALILKGRKAV